MPSEPHQSLIKTCALATGLTMTEVVRIAQLGPKRYKVYQIPKRSGGYRTICHPSRELKALQHVFLYHILDILPIHEAATAYKAGSSIKLNAFAHRSSRVILKLDFQNFFPSIKVADWISFASDNLPAWSQQDISFASHVMFWGAGGYNPVCLSIGAPTSPILSNAMMYQFDGAIAKYAADEGLMYTRYADDITISSLGYLDKGAIVGQILSLLESIRYPRLHLNPAKTKLASKATARRVTGLILANDSSVSLGHKRKRLIRAMVHHALTGKSDMETRTSLAGLLSFALDVEPDFVVRLRQKYGHEAVSSLQFVAGK